MIVLSLHRPRAIISEYPLVEDDRNQEEFQQRSDLRLQAQSSDA